MSQHAGKEAQHNAPHDGGLLQGDQLAPEVRRGRLRDVQRRDVHRRSDAQAVHHPAQQQQRERAGTALLNRLGVRRPAGTDLSVGC